MQPQEQLGALLAWDGELSDAVASDRATKLLIYFSAIMEENAVLKIAAAAAAEEQAKQVRRDHKCSSASLTEQCALMCDAGGDATLSGGWNERQTEACR